MLRPSGWQADRFSSCDRDCVTRLCDFGPGVVLFYSVLSQCMWPAASCRKQAGKVKIFFFWHGDAKPQVRPRACPPPARRRCSSHAFSTTGSNAGTGRPAADPSFIGGRRTKGARQGFGVSFVRSFVCCTCTCTHARVRAHAFAHAKARSADLSSNLPKVAARKSCVQLLPPHMGDTVPLLKPHPIYEGILGTLYAHRRAAATRRTSSHSTPPRTGMPPW